LGAGNQTTACNNGCSTEINPNENKTENKVSLMFHGFIKASHVHLLEQILARGFSGGSLLRTAETSTKLYPIFDHQNTLHNTKIPRLLKICQA
jgi:hypothetical protein